MSGQEDLILFCCCISYLFIDGTACCHLVPQYLLSLITSYAVVSNSYWLGHFFLHLLSTASILKLEQVICSHLSEDNTLCFFFVFFFLSSRKLVFLLRLSNLESTGAVCFSRAEIQSIKYLDLFVTLHGQQFYEQGPVRCCFCEKT